MKIKSIFQLLRPHQWIKNTFIFLPLFFDAQILNPSLLIKGFVAFFAFSAAASSIYCFNDILDVEADRKHPKKFNRPIASNKISIKTAYIVLFSCQLLSLLVLFFLGHNEQLSVTKLIGLYLIMNFAYCLKLKHYPILDVSIIAVGFVIRVMVGGLATNIFLSEWIIIMTFLLALFLAFAKRRDDVIIFNKNGVIPRKNINRYNLVFLNQIITLLSTIVVVSYIMYSLSPKVMEQYETEYVYITSLFVLLGVIRYLQITIVNSDSGSPTRVLYKDVFIQLSIVCWVISFFIIIYL